MLLGSGYFIRRQAPAVAPALASAIPAKSIAVLPLVNESSDKNQQYFSDGLSEEMISALAGEDGFALHAGRHCQP